jgi:hypothetical protein
MRVQDSGFRCCASGGSTLPLAGKAAGLIEEETLKKPNPSIGGFKGKDEKIEIVI